MIKPGDKVFISHHIGEAFDLEYINISPHTVQQVIYSIDTEPVYVVMHVKYHRKHLFTPEEFWRKVKELCTERSMLAEEQLAQIERKDDEEVNHGKD